MLWPDLSAPLVVILGPTGVGKTDLSLDLAERLGGEIVSADSRLFYRGMDIGTAKPTRQERTRVPHHLIDVAAPDEVWSLATFKQAAQAAIQVVQDRGKLPLLVGGTGQYVQAILEDWQIPVQQPDERLREVLENWGRQIGPLELHRKLASIDPQAAANIEPNNVRRTVRAFEVIFLTGRKFSDQRRKGRCKYSVLKVGLRRPRSDLYARIDARIDKMFADGLVNEVSGLLVQGYSAELPSMSAIGYGEVVAFLQGKINLEEAKAQIKRSTRIFVRRQANWFKESDPSIHWFDARAGVVEDVYKLIISGKEFIPAEPLPESI